jgi:hypothetical protein
MDSIPLCIIGGRMPQNHSTEAVTEMKIDNKVLNEIEEAVLELRRTDYWSIGCQIRKHVDSSLDGLYDPEAIAQSIHRDCKVCLDALSDTTGI